MASKQHNALSEGAVVGGCQIERVLGAGGFGITYLATDLSLDRKVAVKEFLPTSLAMRAPDGSSVRPLSNRDEGDLKFGLVRFRDEAQTLARFSHPNIVGVYKYFEDNGTAYLAMPFEEGESLYDILKRHKSLTQDEIDEILPPLLDGLEKVHEAGFLHRDIKPGNIYIRKSDGSPVLLDFGAARQALGAKSMSLTSIVTAGYAPFEQYSTKGNQGPWTDIYALAATVYRAVTGRKPPDASERMMADEIEPAADAAGGKFSAVFLEAIDAALSMKPADRPQSVGEWAAMFHSAPGEATVKKVGAVPKKVRRAKASSTGARRRPGLRYAVAGAIVVVLGVAGVFGYREYNALKADTARLVAARQKAEEAARKAQTARLKAEADAKRRAAEESRRQAEAAARKEAEAALKAAVEKARREAEADARRQAAEKARREAEADIKRKAAEKARRKAAIKARRKALEAARRKAELEKRKRAAAEARRKAAAVADRKAQQARLGGSARIRSVLVGRTARWSGATPYGRGRVNVELRFSGNSVTRVCEITTGRGERRACRTPSGTYRWTPAEPNKVCIHYPRRSGCMILLGTSGAYRLRGFNNGRAYIFVIG